MEQEQKSAQACTCGGHKPPDIGKPQRRTYILIGILILPLLVRTLMLTDDLFTDSLVQWGAILGACAAIIGASKWGNAMQMRGVHYTPNSFGGQSNMMGYGGGMNQGQYNQGGMI